MTTMTITTIPRRVLRAFTLDEDGATAMEYGLIAALIAIAIIGSVTTLGKSVSEHYDGVATEIDVV